MWRAVLIWAFLGAQAIASPTLGPAQVVYAPAKVKITGGSIDGVPIGFNTAGNYLGLNGFGTGAVVQAYEFNYGNLSTGTHAGPWQFITSTDVMNYTGFNSVDGMFIQHNFGGAGTFGARDGLNVILSQTGATSNINNLSNEYVGAYLIARGSLNDNGTNTNSGSSGQLVGANIVASLTGTATNWNITNGMELDTEVATGASVAHKFGLLHVLSGSDAVQGVGDDAAIDFVAGSTSTLGWKYIFQFGKSDTTLSSSSATSSTTTILGCSNNGHNCAVGNGIDLSTNWTWASGFAWKSPGFTVDYLGNAVAKTAQLSAYTVGTLPSCVAGLAGTIAYVTDANAPTYNGTLTGSSTTKTLALCNGSAWVAH
jgi:hypothetical protein